MSGLFGNFFNAGAGGGTAHNAPTVRPGPAPQNPAAQFSGTGPQQTQQVVPSVNPSQQVTAPVSPLDKFADLWQTKTTSDGKPVPIPADPLKQPVFNFDPVKIQATADQMDFTGGINPELVAKALGGDAAAFAEAINTAIRTAVVGMTINSGNLINTALVSNNDKFASQLPTHLKKHQLLESAGSDNPVFNHPNVQPLVQSLKQMALAKDPNASVADIEAQIAGYLTGLSEAVLDSDPTRVSQRKATAPKEQNWSLFLA